MGSGTTQSTTKQLVCNDYCFTGPNESHEHILLFIFDSCRVEVRGTIPRGTTESASQGSGVEDMGEPISLSRSKRRLSVPPELLRLPDHARGAEHWIFLDDRAIDPDPEEATLDLTRKPADEEIDQGHPVPLVRHSRPASRRGRVTTRRVDRP